MNWFSATVFRLSMQRIIEQLIKIISSLGMILRLCGSIIEGKDEVGRLVQIRTKQGDLLRPIQRLFPLEVSCPNDENFRKLIEDPTICEKSEFNISSDPSSLVPDSGEELSPTSVLQRVSLYGRTLRVPHRLDLQNIYFLSFEFQCGKTQGVEYATKSTSTSTKTTQPYKNSSEIRTSHFEPIGWSVARLVLSLKLFLKTPAFYHVNILSY
ncbi:hypothetical protein AVEN_232946-1 [Araneus ventricosus]|uniref:Uncharacterized protein n=1 Tax=Araneus ventricosus TaxID=182803 RepID=A0A4Y2NGC8_ARAVE|nr:hypothetical protein AVEN_232946-1 [Araneus ventricosus]